MKEEVCLKKALKNVIGALVLSIAMSSLAESSVSNVLVNQRWPWSEKVDVDFVLSGETCDVEVTATWDTHPEPYRLGTLFAVAPGNGRLTWDPASSPFKGQTLTGFTVAVSNVAASAHTYLVVGLENGGYEFLSAPPSGGWTAEHKSTKMVFRRIPAGTYTLGEEPSTFTHLQHYSPGSLTTTNCNRRTVTFTSDFYVGIYKYTAAQHACLVPGAAGTTYTPQNVSYESLRGAKPDIDWPNTAYRVSEDSIVAKLRAKAGEGLVVDLCEEEQWEAAARAGKGEFWPTGGTTADTFAAHTNQVNGFVAWYGTGASALTEVGARSDNGWGLFDVVGLVGEWTLDTARNSGPSNPLFGLPLTATDPTGVEGWSRRIVKSANGNNNSTALYDLLPCRRQMAAPDSANYSTRFCIHLKPLGSLTFEGL